MNLAENISKQMAVTKCEIGKDTFYIYPLPAFTAANLSGEVISLLAPLFGSIAGAFKGKKGVEDSNNENNTNLMDMDISEAAPYIGAAFSSLSSDKMENLLRKLLNSGNVYVQGADGKTPQLTDDLCNEIFCRNIQNMFILAFHVLKVNYADFFANIGNPSGNVKEVLKMVGFPTMAPSTAEGSAN